MKKYIIFALIAVVSVTAYSMTAFAKDSKFSNALRNCTFYSESGVVETEGMQVQSTKRITGKQGDRCVYKETVNFSGADVTITCKFTAAQTKELAQVMDAYDLVNQYSGESVDTSKLSGVQDNPVVKAWGKYLQDPSVCKMEGLEQKGY